MTHQFVDRTQAGRLLAARLTQYAGRQDTIVLALPRGGVPVAFEIARALSAPLDVFLVRKLGLPGHEELAMGAIATGGVRVLNRDVVAYLDIPQSIIDAVALQEAQELERRERMYRADRPAPEVRGMRVILVDDGLATGSTMHAAIAALKKLEPGVIVVAVGARRFLLNLREPSAAKTALRRERLERAIGVIYLPETERVSHYFHARLSNQFDAVLHFDETRAIEPLERTGEWETGEVPETFPSGM